MRDIYEIRHENLMILWDRFIDENRIPRHGAIKLYSERLGMSQRYLAHLIARRKRIGVETARSVEKALRIQDCWMDHQHATVATPGIEEEREFMDVAVALFKATPPRERREMIMSLRKRLADTGDHIHVGNEGSIKTEADKGR